LELKWNKKKTKEFFSNQDEKSKLEEKEIKKNSATYNRDKNKQSSNFILKYFNIYHNIITSRDSDRFLVIKSDSVWYFNIFPLLDFFYLFLGSK
tara:strand:- start:11 stop:292 length:282 start_codon:yes stop_codon:yes gene_type:complete